MTPTNVPAGKTPDISQEGGSALESLTAAVAGFEAAQSEALASILTHSKAVGEEVAQLAARPTREELADVQSRLDDSRASHAREAADLKAQLAERDGELKALRTARDKDSETIASFRERFRTFETAAQNIMAGLSVDSMTPATVDVPDKAGKQETAATEAVAAPAEEPALAPVMPAPKPDEDPFDLGLDAFPAEVPAEPAKVILPDLDETDPFDSDPTRAALLAAAVGNVDPFDLPEHAQAEGATFAFNPVSVDEADDTEPAVDTPEAPAAPEGKAGTIVADPFAYMDVDLPADEAPHTPAVQDAPKVVPVYI